MECRCRGASSGLHASASIGTSPVCLLDTPPVSASSPVPSGPVPSSAGPRFSEELWRHGATTYAEILRHPFLTGLTDGSLDRQAFRSFVILSLIHI